MELLKELTNLDAIASNEREVRQYLLNSLSRYSNNIMFDKLGSVIFKIGDKGPKLMVCAHMDEVGYIIKNIEDNGKILLKEIGNVRKEAKENVRCRITTSKGEKIIGIVETCESSNIYIDIGLNNKEDILKLGIEIGNMVCFDTHAKQISNEYIIAKSLDNRVGCYILAEIMKKIYDKELNCTVYFAFTSSEEVGIRGAKTSSYLIDPDYSFVIDVVSPKNSYDYTSKNTRQIGNGFLIEIYDKTFIPNSYMVDLIKATSRKINKNYQLDIMNNGGTDAANIHINKIGVPTVVTVIPVKYCHSPYSMLNIRDVKDLIDVYEELILNFDDNFKIDWNIQ